MGSTNSKKVKDNQINALDISSSLENLEFNKVDRIVKKQVSNLSNGMASEMSDLIIDDVLTISDSESISSLSDNETNQKMSRDNSNLSEENYNNNERIKNVRFCDKVMVITTSEINRFSLEKDYKTGKNFQMVKIYFVHLNDDKYTKGKKQIKFEPKIIKNSEPIKEKLSPRMSQSILEEETKNENQFDQHRTWNIVKENTFYDLKVE